jgi:glucokinase
VNAATGTIWAPNIPGWEHYPLPRRLRDTLNDRSVKIVLANDREASIAGELWQGAARGCRDAVFLAVGTGIGAGILSGGRIINGADGIAGAIGWMALDRPFRNEYIEHGCFESQASGDGLASVFMKRARKRDVTAHELFAACERNDPAARKVLGDAVIFWGMAAANLVSILNPEKVIFGGGVFGPAKRFIADIRAEAERWAQPLAMRRVKFEASKLGADAALHGAAYLALRRARLIK